MLDACFLFCYVFVKLKKKKIRELKTLWSSSPRDVCLLFLSSTHVALLSVVLGPWGRPTWRSQATEPVSFPLFPCRQPPHCFPDTYSNATLWYKIFTTARDANTKYAQDYNPFWCYKGAIGKVYHALNPKLTVIVPDVSEKNHVCVCLSVCLSPCIRELLCRPPLPPWVSLARAVLDFQLGWETRCSSGGLEKCATLLVTRTLHLFFVFCFDPQWSYLSSSRRVPDS